MRFIYRTLAGTMLVIAHLTSVAESYRQATGLERISTVSHRVFGDGKRLAALESGAEITVGRFNDAMRWFATHWPQGAEIPDVLRPWVPETDAPPAQPVEEGKAA